MVIVWLVVVVKVSTTLRTLLMDSVCGTLNLLKVTLDGVIAGYLFVLIGMSRPLHFIVKYLAEVPCLVRPSRMVGIVLVL